MLLKSLETGRYLTEKFNEIGMWSVYAKIKGIN